MKKIAFYGFVKEVDERRFSTLGDRGAKYDNSETDVLGSFKKVAAIANILEVAGCSNFKGSDIANILMILKQVRDANMKKNGQGIYDPTRLDTLVDWHNYLDLRSANEADELE